MRKRKSSPKGARLGQHFLTGVWAAKRLAMSIHAREGETILEIGPGKGIMTDYLIRLAGKVIAVEKDHRLIPQLSQLASQYKNITVVESDILKLDPAGYGLQDSRYKIVANIPYYITGKILQMLLACSAESRK